ncbi:TIR domain-containing protein [Thiothrix fructosivorans]|uniref:TIR domain-containing protein n=1 Tax=Thiothrix fructosivorans TaxID=111770 RepID=A0A8B0SGX3_9GAMM|nr:TIR domain-containing protein [Thiothrix fructosivorans]MBO0611735.1 TIR domain-containing protein [Thiothrix fructosivorans]QTX10606.1 TIR domain-containing protein [Thiothrix fructosivorans]
MHDIFLSYSTKDRERLQPLFQALERQGWSVFWDHRTINIGDHWSKKINHAIRTSKCVVVVWSTASVDSEWVLEEANVAKQRNVLLPIQIDSVDIPVGFTMRQTGDFVSWKADVNDPQFIRLAEKIGELVEQHDAEQAKREAAETAEQERLAQEKAAVEQQARDQAEQQRRLAEEAAEQERLVREKAAAEQQAREDAEQQQRLAEEAAEQKRLAKEKALAEHEAASHQRWLDEAQARLVAEEAAKQKKREQERAEEQKVREEHEEIERQKKAQQEQLRKEKAAAEEHARKEAERQAEADKMSSQNQKPPVKKFPLIPALLMSAAAFGGGGYYWQQTGDLAQAKAALESDDKTAWSDAVARLTTLIASGDTAAMQVLGASYYVGQGVDKDQQKGCQLYKQAADAGDTKAKETYENLPKCH